MFTASRMWRLAAVGAVAAVGWLLGLGGVPLLGLTIIAAVLIQAAVTRIPLRDRPREDGRAERELAYGWGHPLAASMLWGGALFGWFNGTGSSDRVGPAGDGLGGTDGLGGGDFLGGDFGGGGGGGSE